MKTTIYLVRHGHSVANDEHLVAGTFDKGLTRCGHEQAKDVAEFFRNKKIDAVYSSHLPRARQTAQYTADVKNLPLMTEKRIMEFNFGDTYEGMQANDAFEKGREIFTNFFSKIDFIKCDFPNGGENPTVCAKRMYEGIKAIAKANEGKTVVAVTHSIALVCFMAFLNNGYTMDGAMRDDPVPNASISEIEVDGDIVTVKQLGYTGHLRNVTNEKEEVK